MFQFWKRRKSSIFSKFGHNNKSNYEELANTSRCDNLNSKNQKFNKIENFPCKNKIFQIDIDENTNTDGHISLEEQTTVVFDDNLNLSLQKLGDGNLCLICNQKFMSRIQLFFHKQFQKHLSCSICHKFLPSVCECDKHHSINDSDKIECKQYDKNGNIESYLNEYNNYIYDISDDIYELNDESDFDDDSTIFSDTSEECERLL